MYERLTDPALKRRLAPHIEHIVKTAIANGVDPDFAVATVLAESAGAPEAKRDEGKGRFARGLWQVHDDYMTSWGFDPKNDTRHDPVASTTAIMPHLKAVYDKAGGDWALARTMYMRGPDGPMAKKLLVGQPPKDVFKGSPVAANQHAMFARLQSARGTRPPAPAAAPPVADLGLPAAAPQTPGDFYPRASTPIKVTQRPGIQPATPIPVAVPRGRAAPAAPIMSGAQALGLMDPGALWNYGLTY